MKIIVTVEGSKAPDTHSVEPDRTVRDVVATVAGEREDMSLFIADRDDPVAQELTLAEIGIEAGHEITIAQNKKTAVVVRYAGGERTDTVPRTKKMEAIFRWAVGPQGFNLPPDQRPQFELAAEGSPEPVDPSAPVAAYIN